MQFGIRTLASAAAAAVALSGPVAADVVKVAFIDPLSGPMANVGNQGVSHFQFLFDRINARGAVAGGDTFELVTLDNKSSPKEALIQLQKAIDQGARYVVQGNGSSVAYALSDAVTKYNRRNPDAPVLYMNYAAVDPGLTNDSCSYWHFRFDADSDMKLDALTDWLASQDDIKKVYILGQDYSFGKAVSKTTREILAEKRSNIEIVGDELHPMAKIKDFSPYVQKIKASGADAVVTGNWGTDMTLLIKAASAAGMDIPFLTLYGGGAGAPTAMGQSAVGLVKQVTEYHENAEMPESLAKLQDEFEKEYGIDFYYYRLMTMMEMLAKAMDETGSTDPAKVAKALEGMTIETDFGEVEMRADNHQLIQPLIISTLSDNTARDVENTGFGFETDMIVDAASTRRETTCKMRRPGK